MAKKKEQRQRYEAQDKEENGQTELFLTHQLKNHSMVIFAHEIKAFDH